MAGKQRHAGRVARGLVVGTLLVWSTACGATSRDPGVEPVSPVAGADEGPVGPPTDPGAAAPPGAADTDAPVGNDPAAAGSPPPDGDTLVARTAVTEVLDTYGRVLSQMSTDPAGAPLPGSPLRAEWDAIVMAGSVLSGELLDRTTRRALQDRMVIEPDDSGVSFRHRPVDLLAVAPDEVSFTWCGWSPGIGRSVDTGQVVDDAVGHATGTGRITATDAGWRLAALDQEELRLLAPDSADPCTASEVPR